MLRRAVMTRRLEASNLFLWLGARKIPSFHGTRLSLLARRHTLILHEMCIRASHPRGPERPDIVQVPAGV